MRKLARIATGVVVFAVALAVCVDILIWLIDPKKMITPVMQEYLGGSTESLRAALFGFILGALLVHFTEWGKPQ